MVHAWSHLRVTRGSWPDRSPTQRQNEGEARQAGGRGLRGAWGEQPEEGADLSLGLRMVLHFRPPCPSGGNGCSRPSSCVCAGGGGGETSSLPGAAGAHCPPQGARVTVTRQENHWAQIMASEIKSKWGNFT